ncbi:2,3-diaminopropionate biosynthesis protein SbnB [Priestia koreensis]|uniref:2,3-diaminopropionate biosynthesis protein SbnB n=1 Tax=Priestia koreensis TaxID=284581 RepID=UPI003D029704
MLYLTSKDIKNLEIPWEKTINVIEETAKMQYEQKFSQPIKPYLTFEKSPSDRIIAMPAYLGGEMELSGIKWIASFPGNHSLGLPRAHSVTILNNATTGQPLAVLNTALISGIRTASVSGSMIKLFNSKRKLENIVVGISGFGPIGRLHIQMVHELLGDKVTKFNIYDQHEVSLDQVPKNITSKVNVVSNWEEAYQNADIFITCTTSSEGYIDKAPKKGALLLNVSLRDFKPVIMDYCDTIVVDDWEEVCRANTDIQKMHEVRGLRKEQTISLAELLYGNTKQIKNEEIMMFNPMGMAIFDISVANFYYQRAIDKGCGLSLEEDALLV